jgi:hypothetical protein
MKNNRKDPPKGKHLNSPTPQPPPIETAALDNLTPQFFRVLQTLGFEVLIVRFAAHQGSPIWKHTKVEEYLGRQLMAVMVGDYDSSTFSGGVHFHFFHVTDLAKGVQTLKDTIEAIGLLDIAFILHAESASELRFYYPPHDPENQVAKI